MVKQHSLFGDKTPPMKTIRELLGLTQQEFATKLGVAVSTVSRWENGKTNPQFTVGQFKVLLKALRPYKLGLKDLPDDMRIVG